MSPSKKAYFANLPRRQSPRLKALNSPSKSQEESNSSASIQIKSELSDCEESISSFTFKQKDCVDAWGPQEMISLKDLRAKCQAKKRRKKKELDFLKSKEDKSESDLDEPLIVLRVKRSKVSPCNKKKNKGVNEISQCLDNAILQSGISEENPRVNEETIPIQADRSATSAPNNSTSSDACTSDSIYQVKNEPSDQIEISNASIDSSNLICIVKNEILENEAPKEGDQIDIFPSKVDFVAKFNSSMNQSSYPIWPANENVSSGETLTCSLNESCTDYLEFEEHFESPQNKLHESEITEELNQFEEEKSRDAISGSSKVDCVNSMDIHTENRGIIDHGFLCEEAPDFLDISSFGSTDGQLESIVYNAINTINSGEEKNQQKSVKVLETQSNGVLQLCNKLEEEQSEPITENGGAELKKTADDDQIIREEPAPVKLLSNRNIISPTSQEKLCQALTGIDICDGTEFSKCKKRILFENWTKAKKTSSESSVRSPVRNFQKPRGVIAKKPNGNSSPVKMNTQKAVEFSQRQMQDFENIANKLLKSMKFMKNVLDESLAVDSPPLLSKFSFNEIKAASENASELDKMTRKWLTIMSKDCNRFCKILSSAGEISSPTAVNNNNNNENQNKRRKIVFADEAGGVLCQIRVFSQPETSIPATQTENKSEQ